MNKTITNPLLGTAMGVAMGALVTLGLTHSTLVNAQVFPPIQTPQPTTITPFDASPYNYNNSEFNFNNSPYNYNNSPYNYDNSPYNFNSPNRIYDNNGNAQGYSTQTPSGVTNYFDFNGNRLGYQPAQ